MSKGRQDRRQPREAGRAKESRQPAELALELACIGWILLVVIWYHARALKWLIGILLGTR